MTSPTRASRQISTRTGTARIAVAVSALLVVGPALAVPPASAAAPPAAVFVDLGSAAGYSVLAGAGVANTGTATVLALDLGLSPAGVIAGFPPGTVTGTIHDKDAAAEQAQADRQAAYDAAAAQTGGTPFAGDQAGATFKPGLHTSAAAFTNTGTMTLDADGDPGAVFVIQVGAALSSAAASKVVLTDGALPNNVYWQVLGAVTLGAGATYVGTILGAGAVALGEGASLKGRILTPGTVALANSPVTQPIDDLTAPVVSVDGGATRSTDDTSPVISGSTGETGGAVIVTVSGQTLTSPIGPDGGWSVSARALTEGPHELLASVTDASRNTGTATQVLTVDVTAPAVSIDGGAARSTDDRTPSISGTTDRTGHPTVTVTVAGQTLTSAVGVGGAWTVTPATLDETAHQVVASVADAAGNTGATSQIITVDVTRPVVTIDGGATRSTADTSPWTYGTTGERAGSTVRVTVGGQSLATTAAGDGTWGVSAQSLAQGTHRVVASITDAGGNTGTATQTLIVGNTPVIPSSRFRPDAAVRRGSGAFAGAGTYGDSAGQRRTAQLRRTTKSASFTVRLTNDGNATDTVLLRGTPRNRKFKVVYRAAGSNVTAAVTAGRYRSPALGVGRHLDLTVRITRTRAARPGARRVFVIRAVSAHDSGKSDTVAAVVRR